MQSIPRKLIVLYVKKTLRIKIQVFRTKNERLILKLVCSECNNKKSSFVSKNEGSGLSPSLGIRTPLGNVPLLNVLF